MAFANCAARRITAIEPLEQRSLMAFGDLDLSFGANGKASVNFGDGLVTAADIAVQPDGKIVAVSGSVSKNFNIARFNANGTPDTSFGGKGTGRATIDMESGAVRGKAIAIAPDGKIVVIGTLYYDSNIARIVGQIALNIFTFDNTPFNTFENKIGVASFNADGTIDKSFGEDDTSGFGPNGKTALSFATSIVTGSNDDAEAVDVAVQKDGKIVVAGYAYSGEFGSDADFVLARLTSSGKYDADGDYTEGSFGENSFLYGRSGQKFAGFGGDDFAHAMAIDYNGTPETNPYYGKIVVVGRTGSEGSSRIAVARFNTNGDLDGTFTSDGKVDYAYPGAPAASGESLVLQPGGKIVIGATVGNGIYSGTAHDFALVRFLPNGTVDPTFTGGQTRTEFGGDDRANVLLADARGRLISGGYSNGNFAIARYSAEGVLDSTFGKSGKVTTDLGGIDQITSMALSADENLTVAGIANAPFTATSGTSTAVNFARYINNDQSVTVETVDSEGSETAPNAASVNFKRAVSLPTPLRVYFTVDGTATGPTATTPGDYTVTTTGTTLGVLPSGTRYVDIPAYQTSIGVSFVPVDDTESEGESNETIVLTVVPSLEYARGAALAATLTIADNDVATANRLLPVEDTYVAGGMLASQNYSALPTLNLRTSNTAEQMLLAYVKFDLRTAGKFVGEAKFRVYGNFDAALGSAGVGVYATPNITWQEQALFFTNRPVHAAAPLATATLLPRAKYVEFDVSSYVRSELAFGRRLITLTLKRTDTATPLVKFNSSDATTNKPELVITSQFRASDDAYVSGGTLGATNYGSDPTLLIRSGTLDRTRLSYLKFDARGAIPTVSRAILRLYGSHSGLLGNPLAFGVYGVADTRFTEGALTYNTRPSFGSAQIAAASVGTTAGFIDIDVTDYVKSQFSVNKKIVAFGLGQFAGLVETATFNSGEAATNQPALLIG